MKTITLELEQGSPDWENYLLVSNGASEASTVLGISRTGKRNELLAAKATGIAKTFSDYVRRFVLDRGHEVEALARPIAEEFIGEELVPVVMAKDNIRASCDGLTMDETIAWENKQYNAEYFELVSNGELPEEHWPQCQQVLYVTGAEKLYFTISDGAPERTVGVWVYPDKELQLTILDAWAQFEIDLKNYKHVEIVEPPKAAIIQSLPAVTVMAYGEVTTCNLPQLTPVFDKFLREVKRTGFVTDDDFSIAEGCAKEARSAAKGCVTSKEMAIKGMLSVSEVIDTLSRYESEFNALGLALEKAVKAEKDNRKANAKLERDKAYADHVAAINAEIKPITLVMDASDKPNFVECMKNQRTLASLYNKLDTELARCKIAADAVAKSIREKKAWLKENADGYQFLFNDLQSIIYKQIDDFQLIANTRVKDHKAAKEAELEADRKRIQQEEESKAKAKLDAEQAEKDRIALESRILSQTELAKSMLTPVGVVYTVDQVRAESVRLAHLLAADLNELEADAYQKYSVKLAEYADKMEVAAKLAGEELARRQALSSSTDPDDIIRAEIKDLRERASHIYQRSQYCDNGTTRRAEESQYQSLNIKASKLEKELDIQIRIKANIELAASWLDESVDILTLDAGAVMAESERLFDLITENTSFAEVNSYSAHSKQLMNLADEIIAVKPISAAKIVITGQSDVTYEEIPLSAYIPPSKTGWDDPVIESQCVDTVVIGKSDEQSYMSKDKVRILKAVMAEFGCGAGDAESRIIAAFIRDEVPA